MDPESKLLVVIDVGDRTLAMAQRVVHRVAQTLASACAPLFLTDGFLDGRRRGRHQGSEDRWDAMSALFDMPFCSYDARWVSL